MLPFLIIAGLFVATAAVVVFWEHVHKFFIRFVVPLVSRVWGPQWGKVLENVIDWIDKAMVFTRLKIKSSWDWIKSTILGCHTKYQREGDLCKQETDSYVLGDGGYIEHTVTKAKVSIDELPEEIQSAVRHWKPVAVNDKNVLLNRLKNRAEEEGTTLEL